MNPSPGSPSVALVDWGTSRLRIWLLDDSYRVLSSRSSDHGVASIDDDTFESVLLDEIRSAGSTGEIASVVMCGMVGSSIGWIDAGYAPCPIAIDDLAGRPKKVPALRFDAWVVPGLQCTSPLGEPDVMRGEETQVLGWSRSTALPAGRHALCLPGTHTKWVSLADRQVEHFHTSFTGELFRLLSMHSILVRGPQADDAGARAEGLRAGLRVPALSQSLFTTRSRVVAGQLGQASARSYLSGLLIGADVRSALDLAGLPERVDIIGAGNVSSGYAEAFRLLDVACQVHDGEMASRIGLEAVARKLSL